MVVDSVAEVAEVVEVAEVAEVVEVEEVEVELRVVEVAVDDVVRALRGRLARTVRRTRYIRCSGGRRPIGGGNQSVSHMRRNTVNSLTFGLRSTLWT